MSARSDYAASTTFFDKTKGKWYVSVTIPTEIRPHFKGRAQLKRSTGTSDRRLAEQKSHGITEAIYCELDKANVDPLTKAMRELSAVAPKTDIYDPKLSLARPISGMSNEDVFEVLAGLHMVYLQCELWSLTEDFTPLADASIAFLRAYNALDEKPDAYSTRGLSSFVDEYFLNSRHKRVKEARAAKKYIESFIRYLDDPIPQSISKPDAYAFAKMLEAEGLANSTIKTRVSAVSSLLVYLEQSGVIESSPWVSLKLSGYGVAKQHYKALGEDLLLQLFSQALPDEIRLTFSILISTGMRLDEVVLLEWTDVKLEKGIWYFDLTGTDKIIKNIGSARKVPAIEYVQGLLGLSDIQHAKTGRVFPQFKVNVDGKAQGSASKALMPWVRNITKDARHVNHSLRGDFKDLCRTKNISKEQHDFITGHAEGDSASAYGDGPSLKVRYDILSSLEHPWFKND